jgi:RNA-directed DNA polymerase
MGKLKLTVNEETRIYKVPEGEFDFLGYTRSGECFSAWTGQARIGYRPSKKSTQPWSRKSTR